MKPLATDKLWTAIDGYFAETLVSEDAALEAALKESEAAGLPAIQVAPNQGKLLMLLAQAIGARNILEIGTLGGYSTVWLARGLGPEGRLITLEANADYAKVAKRNIEKAGLGGTVDIRVGRAIETLPGLTKEAPFDLTFIDADKPGTPDYFQWAVKLSRKGSLIIVDNVVREGAILESASRDESIKAMRRFFDLAASDARVTGTAIQTVGAKGHDGLAVLLVTGEP